MSFSFKRVNQVKLVSNFVPLAQILKKVDQPVCATAKRSYIEEDNEDDLEAEREKKGEFSFKWVNWDIG